MTKDITALIHEIARDLIRRNSTQEEIDGRFLFKVWDDAWIGWVVEVRRSLFDQDEPPFLDDLQRHTLTELEDVLVHTIKNQLDEFVGIKCRDTGFWRSDVSGHILFGSPIALPRLATISELNGITVLHLPHSFAPRVVVLIYSDDVTGEEIEGHVKRTAPFLRGTKPRRRIQTSQHGYNLVRTWTVMCLARKSGMTHRNSIAHWNKWFPNYSYGKPGDVDESDLSFSVTSSALSHYSRDRRKLTKRLNLTS